MKVEMVHKFAKQCLKCYSLNTLEIYFGNLDLKCIKCMKKKAKSENLAFSIEFQ